MKRLLLILFLVISLVGCSAEKIESPPVVTTQPTHIIKVMPQELTAPRGPHLMEVYGPDEFIKDIEEALALLKAKAPEHHDLVMENIYSTYYRPGENNSISGLTREYGMSEVYYTNVNKTGKAKVYYIATTLVHEDTHGKRIKEGIIDYNNVEHEEWLAVEEQKKAAKLIKAPDVIIKYLEAKMQTKWWEKQGR